MHALTAGGVIMFVGTTWQGRVHVSGVATGRHNLVASCSKLLDWICGRAVEVY